MILHGDALTELKKLDSGIVQTCITSPPYYGLRDYGVDGQLGLESTPEEYIARIVEIFAEVKRVLRDDGTLWLVLGDSYAKAGESGLGLHGETSTSGKPNPYAPVKKMIPHGLKPKDLCMIPARVALALQAEPCPRCGGAGKTQKGDWTDWYLVDCPACHGSRKGGGWWLRSDIIWHKPNPMPESVTDRPTSAHEHVFLLAKSQRYFYDADAIREYSTMDAGTAGTWNGNRDFGLPNGITRFANPNLSGSIDGYRNKRNVWTVATKPYPGAHFAVYPPALIEPCVLAGSAEGDTVLDPFCGSGTTGEVAYKHRRQFIGIELNPEYVQLAEKRLREVEQVMF